MTEFTNRDISPVIYAAINIMEKVEGVENIKLLSSLMFRTTPTEDYPIGRLGVDIIINKFKTFLPYEFAEDMVTYPQGVFVAQEFVYLVLNYKDKSKFIDDENADNM